MTQSPEPYWSGDGITLYLGDCREITEWLTADVLVTDPPYGQTALEWDRWITGWPTLAATGPVSMWCFGTMRMFLERRDEFAAWNFSQDVVWAKPRARGMAADRFARAHELVTFWYRGNWSGCYRQPQTEAYHGPRVRVPGGHGQQGGVYGGYTVATYDDNGTRLMTTVLQGSAGDPRRILHPTQKPTEVLESLISYACPPGGTIADPFAGSGSTLVAARNQGRQAIGVEIDERYAERAARRLDQGILTEVANDSA